MPAQTYPIDVEALKAEIYRIRLEKAKDGKMMTLWDFAQMTDTKRGLYVALKRGSMTNVMIKKLENNGVLIEKIKKV